MIEKAIRSSIKTIINTGVSKEILNCIILEHIGFAILMLEFKEESVRTVNCIHL